MSLALACAQAHAINSALVTALIRHTSEGQITTEIKQFMMATLTPNEAALSDWWRLLHVRVEPELLRPFVATMIPSSYFEIFPVVPLGLQTRSNEVLYSRDTNHWARSIPGGWQTVNVQGLPTQGEPGLYLRRPSPGSTPPVPSPSQESDRPVHV